MTIHIVELNGWNVSMISPHQPSERDVSKRNHQRIVAMNTRFASLLLLVLPLLPVVAQEQVAIPGEERNGVRLESRAETILKIF